MTCECRPAGNPTALLSGHQKNTDMRPFFIHPCSLFLFLLFIVTGSYAQPLAPNQLVLPEGNQTIPFAWKADSLNGKWDQHTAMLIPVKLPNCPKQFYMQFDLGAPSSLLYRNKLKDISARYPGSVQLNDTASMLKAFSFRAGKVNILAKEIMVKQFSQSRLNWDKNSVEVIGTIGSDLIDDRTVMINYPRQQISLSTQRPVTPDLQLTDFIFARRSILLPAIIRGKKKMLYFDTGSSAFELLTDKETAESLAAPGAVAAKYPVRSWDKIMTANTLATNDSIEIAQLKIPLAATTYMEGFSNSQVSQMMKMGIGGMTGNKLFLDYILVLDTRNKKFGLMKEHASGRQRKL
jgi:hypothetical protein